MRTILAILLSALAANAAHNVSLSWDQNTDNVTGYKLYIGTQSGVYYASNILVGVTNTTSTFTGLTNGQYFFAATAYLTVSTNLTLESGFSAEVQAQLGPHIPKNLKSTNSVSAFVFTNSATTIVEWSEDLDVWRTDAPPNLAALTVTLDLANPKQQFWRVR